MYGALPAKIKVALRKESVDRNFGFMAKLLSIEWSLSARRAWIEMVYLALIRYLINVALRKESVDRNDCFRQLLPQSFLSLSARRAWIEILHH